MKPRVSVWLLEFALLVLICGSSTFSATYNNYQSFTRGLASAPPPGDTLDYLRMYAAGVDVIRGASGSAVDAYRVLVPLLAHIVPDPPSLLFRPGRPFDTYGIAAFKFAVLTALFTFATAALVYALCRHFRLSRLLSLLGAEVYVTLTFVLVVDGIPHVDEVFFFLFGLGAYGLITRRRGLVIVSMLFGMTVKEPIFILAVLALLLPGSLQAKVNRLLLIVPFVLIYGIWRYTLSPTPDNYFLTGAFLTDSRAALQHLFTFNGIEWVFMAFNFLWAVIAWIVIRAEMDPFLFRSLMLIPFLLLITILGGSDHFGRTLLLAYPAAIPAAMLGVQRVLGQIELRQHVTAVESALIRGPQFEDKELLGAATPPTD